MRLEGRVDKGWGYENIWATCDHYCGKFMLEDGTIIEVSTADSVEDNYRVEFGDSQ